jgi:UTP--glucose-1-phosphate uridylyltransferase
LYVTDGQYFDIGDRQGLLTANNFMDTGGLPVNCHEHRE